MTAAEAFRAAMSAGPWDEYRRLIAVAEQALLDERTELLQQENHNRKVTHP